MHLKNVDYNNRVKYIKLIKTYNIPLNLLNVSVH